MRWTWLLLIIATVVIGLLTRPLLGEASLGVAIAVFLGGLTLISAENNYGRPVTDHSERAS